MFVELELLSAVGRCEPSDPDPLISDSGHEDSLSCLLLRIFEGFFGFDHESFDLIGFGLGVDDRFDGGGGSSGPSVSSGV